MEAPEKAANVPQVKNEAIGEVKKQRITDAKKTSYAPKPIKTKGAHGADFYMLEVSLPECPSGSFSKVEVQYMRVKDKKGDTDPWLPSVEVHPATLEGADPEGTVDFKLTGLEASTRYRARSRARGRPDSEFGQWSTDEGAVFQTDKDGQTEAGEGVQSLYRARSDHAQLLPPPVRVLTALLLLLPHLPSHLPSRLQKQLRGHLLRATWGNHLHHPRH